MHRRCSSRPMRDRYSWNDIPFVTRSSKRCTVRSNLAFGMSTKPIPARSSTPSQGAQVPRCRFSAMAMIKPTSSTRRIHTVSNRRARCTPTTPKMGSSVYMCAKYRRCWLLRSASESRRLLRKLMAARASCQRTADGRVSRGTAASTASISSRNRCSSASLNL